MDLPVSVGFIALLTGLAAAGLSLGLLGLVRVVRRRPLSGAGLGAGGVLLLVLAGAGAAVLAQLYTYHRLTLERPV
ncbi:MAG TPA: hypothetical protein VKA13_06690, partial [Gammaproteobacteria bacterium]|nr:hypothetical protein [Gammaproteobacteria bacterium]